MFTVDCRQNNNTLHAKRYIRKRFYERKKNFFSILSLLLVLHPKWIQLTRYQCVNSFQNGILTEQVAINNSTLATEM